MFEGKLEEQKTASYEWLLLAETCHFAHFFSGSFRRGGS